MAQLYPAVANSPQTELTAAIPAAATTITVLDASKLPDGPNLATIGVDETAETILYTAKSGNTLSGVTRGFDGTTAKAWQTGTKIARYLTAYDINALQGVSNPAAAVPITLTPGQQVIQAERPSPLQHMAFKGRTLVNLLGRDGNFEDVSKYTVVGGTIALDTSDFNTGLSSIVATSNASSGSIQIRRTNSIDPSKFYIAVAMVKNVTTNYAYIRAFNADGAVTIKSALSATVKTWASVFFKLAPADLTGLTQIRLDVCADFTASGQQVKVDSLRLYEISAADYAAIDSMTADQVAARWPYTEGIVSVDRVWMKKSGKNLLPPFTDSRWTLHANAKAIEPYKLTVNVTASGQLSRVAVPALPSQQYTLTIPATAHIDVAFINSSGANVYKFTKGNNSAPYTFTTDADTAQIQVTIYANTSSGIFTFANPQIELGSAATAFVPNTDQSIYLTSIQAAANVDGSVADQVYQDGDGRFRVMRRFRTADLSGDLPWLHYNNFTGFKRVGVASGISAVAGSGIAAKYDSKPLTVADTANAADRVAVNASEFIVSISNAESGWGDSYTPTADEIKAYFLGWKMFIWTQPATTAYNGTGTKGWLYRKNGVTLNGDSDADGWTQTLPTTQAPNWTPCRLQYQLAAPVDEQITQEGSISLHAGQNLIEVGTGIVVRERADPRFYSAAYWINAPSLGGSLRYRPGKILNIKRDGKRDLAWTIFYDGVWQASCAAASFDPSAVYSVTYLTLDTYKLGIAPDSMTADYGPNLRGAVDAVVEALPALSARLDALETGAASKDAPGWITPTLLNGWSNRGQGTDAPASYFRNSSGFVHLRGIVTGGISGTLYTLPSGYRPLYAVQVLAMSVSSGGTLITGYITISPSGALFLNAGMAVGAGSVVFLDDITFQAGQ
ncbi:hypothetical protein [Gorillibacterium sp. sgz500922]|uniref:hypothetical protein n=1 Tax=Gorillibacterium sp. sgz500922 TaxID=3446694 RepID=UPI003F67FC56